LGSLGKVSHSHAIKNTLLVTILFEDNHLIAVAKKAGQPVQPEEGKPTALEDLVKAYIKESKQKPGAVFLGVIHRLDMPVTGVVLFAKTSKALVRMNKLFQERGVDKRYTALVHGTPQQKNAKLTHYLVRDDSKRISKAYVKEVPHSQKAELEYTILEKQGANTKLEIKLLTGRKHQIRAQLSAIGHPIVGDVKYKSTVVLANQAILLCATYLSFKHPVTSEQIQVAYAPSF
jgi:23S rRNA pseudouridine1911/1915/1917 synthase